MAGSPPPGTASPPLPSAGATLTWICSTSLNSSCTSCCSRWYRCWGVSLAPSPSPSCRWGRWGGTPATAQIMKELMRHLVVGSPGGRGPREGRAPSPASPSRGSPGCRAPPGPSRWEPRPPGRWPRDGSTGPRPRGDRAGDRAGGRLRPAGVCRARAGGTRVPRLRSQPGDPTPPRGRWCPPTGGACAPAHSCAWRGGAVAVAVPVPGDNEGPHQHPELVTAAGPGARRGRHQGAMAAQPPPWGSPVPRGSPLSPPREAKAAAAHRNPECFPGGNTERGGPAGRPKPPSSSAPSQPGQRAAMLRARAAWGVVGSPRAARGAAVRGGEGSSRVQDTPWGWGCRALARPRAGPEVGGRGALCAPSVG